MSNALNLIIARGFPELGTAVQDGFNRQRQANNQSAESQTGQAINEFKLGAAQQEQTYQAQDRAAAQKDAAELNQLLQGVAEVDARLRQNPNDPDARRAAVELATRIEAIQKGGSKSVAGILGLEQKGAASQAKPVIVMGPNGPEYADPLSAVGKPAYVRPQASTTVNVGTPKPPNGYLWVDPSNPSAGVMPIAGGPQDPAAERPISKEEIAANRKAEAAKKDSLRVYNTYQTAMKSVSDALANTTTGPVAGRLPAFSAEQQIAEGAVAAIAPILKQLFRAAGEGVFTDRDQQLLLDMVPTRTDRQQAKDAKIANINAIVASKLGIESVPQTSKAPSEMTDAEIMDALNANP